MKNKGFCNLLIFTMVFFVLSGCSSKVTAPVNKEPEQIYYSGKAKITAIVPSAESSDHGMYDIYYDFTPLNTSYQSLYKYPETSDKNIKLYHDHRESFHMNWIKKWDIKEGNIYPALRLERKNNLASGNNVNFEILLDSPQK